MLKHENAVLWDSHKNVMRKLHDNFDYIFIDIDIYTFDNSLFDIFFRKIHLEHVFNNFHS